MISHKLYVLRLVALKISYPLIRSMVRCYCFLKRYRRGVIGNCTFRGPKEWISLCENAVQLLREKDPPMVEALETRDVFFFRIPER